MPMPIPIPAKVEDLKTSELHFDWQNPRLAEFGITSKTSEDEILTVLWESMDVRELVQSIAASGFFRHEPIIVARENTRLIVIEGNRRLAAVKVLLNSELAAQKKWEIPALSKDQKEKLGTLPAIVASRKESWRYLGFKHVNGPAKWSSFAKAKYIAEVHKHYKISLQNIAEQIGDRHRTVQRLFRGLMVLDQAISEKKFSLEDKWPTRFAFSHLYTGLDYDGVAEFLNIQSEADESVEPVPSKKLPQLSELLLWLYGSKKKSLPPVIASQNPDLRRLDAVLKSREAVAALRDSPDLNAAFEISRPPGTVFEESLLKAKRELTRASGYLTTGYDGSEELLRVAGSIANLADTIYQEMERKHAPSNKKRVAEE